jgi:hypothetical protein
MGENSTRIFECFITGSIIPAPKTLLFRKNYKQLFLKIDFIPNKTQPCVKINLKKIYIVNIEYMPSRKSNYTNVQKKALIAASGHQTYAIAKRKLKTKNPEALYQMLNESHPDVVRNYANMEPQPKGGPRRRISAKRFEELQQANARNFEKRNRARQERSYVNCRVQVEVNQRIQYKGQQNWFPHHVQHFTPFFRIPRNATRDELRALVADYLTNPNGGIYPIPDETQGVIDIDNFDFHEVVGDAEIPYVHQLDVPMRRAKPARPLFLDYFKSIDPISFEDTNGDCVIKALMKTLDKKIEYKITDKLREIHEKLYCKNGHVLNWQKNEDDKFFAYETDTPYKTWSKTDGVSTRMLLEYCKAERYSLMAFDQKENMFAKHVPKDKRHDKSPIYYYCTLSHMYLISAEEAKTHLRHIFTSSTNVNSSIRTTQNEDAEEKKEEKEEVFEDGCELFQLPQKYELWAREGLFERVSQLENVNIILPKDYLDDIMRQSVEQKIIPKVKFSSMRNIKSMRYENGVKLFAKDNYATHGEIKTICNQVGIPFKNQSFTEMLLQLLEFFYTTKRERIPAELKEQIIKEQNGVCNDPDCQEVHEKYQIDHIIPLINGGTNNRDNLQALCISCHREKTITEKESLEHIRTSDHVSSFNLHTNHMIKSDYFKIVQFCEFTSEKKCKRYKNLHSKDMNKCRRNLLAGSEYDWCIFNSLDDIQEFNPKTLFDKTGKISAGFYYVETEVVFPIRKNGFYPHPMIDYCLKEGLLQMDQIKYEFKPTKTLKNDYFKPFVAFVLDLFKDLPQLAKLSINSIIGLFGRLKNNFFDNEICTKTEKDMFQAYHKFTNPFQSHITSDYCVITNKSSFDKLDNSYPIYAQVLALEAIELHKLCKIIESKGGIPLCLKTDAVVYRTPRGKKLNLDEYFWDAGKKLPKYKDEPGALCKKPYNITTPGDFVLGQHLMSATEDDETDNFNLQIADKIIESGKGCFIDGLPGVGKTATICRIIKRMNERNLKIIKLAPTNIASALIDGDTIDKFGIQFLRNPMKRFGKLRNIDYILIDEFSMVKSMFYPILLSIKLAHPHIKFILSGNFDQLAPVKDVVKGQAKFEKARALWELTDGNRVLLSKCRRSDDKVHKLTLAIKNREKVDFDPLSHTWNSFVNICHTNKYRKEVIAECVERFLAKHPNARRFAVRELYYDKNTQPFELCEEMPVIARINCKALKFANNEQFLVKKIKDDEIILTNEKSVINDEGDIVQVKKEISVPTKTFHKQFMSAFCITLYKSQGQTFKTPYCIHEFEKYSRRMKLVAVSRATAIDNINIVKKNKIE